MLTCVRPETNPYRLLNPVKGFTWAKLTFFCKIVFFVLYPEKTTFSVLEKTFLKIF